MGIPHASDREARVASDLCIGHDRLRSFIAGIFAAAGSSPEEARIVSDHLVNANLTGHDSHGLTRAAKYVDWIRDGQLLPNRHAAVVKDTPALLVVDGGFGYGQVIAREAMELAAERARQFGLCTVAIRNAGHLGRIGAWPEQLAQAGFASIHFVNTSGFGILVAPYGGSDRRLSANPIAAGAPRPRREAQAGRRRGRRRSAHDRPGSVLRAASRCDSSVWRPQRLGSLAILRDPGRLPDRRAKQPPRQFDCRTARQ